MARISSIVEIPEGRRRQNGVYSPESRSYHRRHQSYGRSRSRSRSRSQSLDRSPSPIPRRGRSRSFSSRSPSSNGYNRTRMKVMVVEKNWFSREILLAETGTPKIKDNEVLISICAAGVYEDDLRKSDNGICPGIECSGTIALVGRNVSNWKINDRVCTILDGGGYAEQVAVPADLLLPVPEDISLKNAATLPYATCVVWMALFNRREKYAFGEETLLIHDGASKIGLLAIQLAKHMGMQVIATTESYEDSKSCDFYGADYCVDRTKRNFVEFTMFKTKNIGVNFVIDYGASDLQENLNCCALKGKVLIINSHGEDNKTVNLSSLVFKHLQVEVIDLKSRSLNYKTSVVQEVRNSLWRGVMSHTIVPVVYKQFSMEDAEKAVEQLEKNKNLGRIILCNDFGRNGVVGEPFDRHLKIE